MHSMSSCKSLPDTPKIVLDPEAPIAGLPLDLIFEIADCLVGDTKSLINLSRVSPNFRKATEKPLYTNLKFSIREVAGCKLLLVKLLDREELQEYIKDIKIGICPANAYKEPGDPGDHMKKYENKIRTKIESLIDTVYEEKARGALKRNWITELLRKDNTSLDAAAALLLHLAPNLECIELDLEQDLPLTKQALDVPFRSGNKLPFKNLKELSIGSATEIRTAITLRPSVTSLKLHFPSAGSFNMDTAEESKSTAPFTYPLPQDTIASLHTLTFLGFSDVTPSYIAALVSSKWLTNLRKLFISHCGSDARMGNDLTRVVRELEKHVPDLEVLDYRQHAYASDWVTYDTFRNLGKLRELCVDYASLVRPSNAPFTSLPNSWEIFPTSLEDLTLDYIPMVEMTRFLSMFYFHKESREIKTVSDIDSRTLKDVALEFPFKHLTFCIDYIPGHRLRAVDIEIIRSAADELVQVGMFLEVYRGSKFRGDPYRLLVKPGWTAEANAGENESPNYVYPGPCDTAPVTDIEASAKMEAITDTEDGLELD